MWEKVCGSRGISLGSKTPYNPRRNASRCLPPSGTPGWGTGTSPRKGQPLPPHLLWSRKRHRTEQGTRKGLNLIQDGRKQTYFQLNTFLKARVPSGGWGLGFPSLEQPGQWEEREASCFHVSRTFWSPSLCHPQYPKDTPLPCLQEK